MSVIPQRRNDPSYIFLLALALKALQEGLNIVAVTAAYAMGGEDVVLADTTTSGFTVTLPAVKAANRREVVIKKTDGSAHTLTVSGDANIDGSASVSSSTAYAKFRLISDGMKWNQA